MEMDSQFDEVIRGLPVDYEAGVLEDRRVDEIIRNLPEDYEERVMTDKRVDGIIDEIASHLPSTAGGGNARAVKRKADDQPGGNRPKRARGKHACPTCGKEVDDRKMAQHKRIHNARCYDCPFCEYKGGKSLEYMRQHYKKFHSAADHKCPKCGEQFGSEVAFFLEPHLSTCIKCIGHENPPLEPLPDEQRRPIFFHDPIDPPDIEDPFWRDPLMSPHAHEEAAVTTVQRNWSFFRQRFDTESPLVREYYFRTVGTDVAMFTMADAMRHVYSNANTSFNFNIGLSTLLSRETNAGTEYRIFIAQNNRNNLFERNILVYDLASLEEAIKRIDDLGDLADHIERPGSDWKVIAVLGVGVFVYLRPNFVAGRGGSRLPTFLTCNKKTVISMDRNMNRDLYEDNLCLFRCIIASRKEDPHDMEVVKEAYETYRQEVNGTHWREFQGVPENHLEVIEQLFNINMNVYRKVTMKNTICLRKGDHMDRPVVHVHSHPIEGQRVHFSLILNVNNFCGRHICNGCKKMFKREDVLRRHIEQNCNDGITQYTYKDGCYEARGTIFDQMAGFGIFVDDDRRRNDSFIVWDMEACLEPMNLKYELEKMNEGIEQRLNNQNIEVEYVDKAKGLQMRERHRPVTGAIKSSVAGCEDTQFFHNVDPDLLVKEIFAAMIEISDKNYELKREQFAQEFQKLDEIRQLAESEVTNANDDEKRFKTSILKKIQRLERNFDKLLRQCVVLTFNGGRYDLNLCKRHLFPCLTEKVREARNEGGDGQDDSRSWPKAITRGSAILCLATNELRFLDVTLYCPGTNLDKFTKTFNPDGDIKGCFPYELLRSPEDLNQIREFPPKSAFYSTLKNGGISQTQYDEAKTIWDNLPEPKTLLDYIRWYNSRDVEPFLEACKNMHKIFYTDFGIDIFQQAQSIPGVCLAFLFKRLHELRPTTRFGLFNESQATLQQEMSSSMTGGLAIIVNRIAEKGKTAIRGNKAVLTEKILGLDFNALYLWAMCQDTPSGYPDHFVLKEDGTSFERKSETMEEKLKRRRCHGEVEYMKFAAFRDGLYIHHSEHGPQTQLGPKQWKVDGYAKDAKPKPRVYEYKGCYYHCHENGCLNRSLNLTTANRSQIDRDTEKETELMEMGFDVHVVWECQFKEIKRLANDLVRGRRPRFSDPDLLEQAEKYNEFLKKHPKRKFENSLEVPQEEMKEAILNGTVFGFCKVDLTTPEELREKYSDFPPIIKHAEIGKEDIGEYMREIAENLGQMEEPRKCLINSYHCKELWLMTPLIQFYHSHGIEILRIHEVCQFDRERPFEWFGETVTEHRKMGDADPSKATLGGIFKLLGNSAYGKTITNLMKHMDVFYTDAAEIPDLHNDPFHHRTVEISPNCFEIHKRKESIQFNLPMQIGLSVYAWAKWKLLAFIYDVLQVYIPRACYDFLESDTDSIYVALSKPSLKECVPQERMVDFERIEPLWFVLEPSQIRTPGLLKTEIEGVGFVGLSAKSYVVLVDEATEKTKNSAKGVQSRNMEILTYENYKRILFQSEEGVGTAFNIGIRPINGTVFTYIQSKTGLSPLYVKRNCLPDHRTLPLEI